MYIQPNRLLSNNYRTLKPYACSFIATEGPNILGKLDLSGIEIPYDTQYTTRLYLQPGITNQPLYGNIGNNVTFVLLKITYDETDPNCMVEEEQFIEYYYEDQPTTIRYANKLLVLTGNSVNRIPKIYINNPGTVSVIIDALVANIGQNDLLAGVTQTNVTLITNLYHNSIISDKLLNNLTHIYGSTQLKVIDFEDNVSLYLDYLEIDTIQVEIENKKLIIKTKSDVVIHLVFLSEFETYQAHSRIEWVIEDSVNRFLTKDIPAIDTTAPTITLNNGVVPIIDNIYTIPVTLDVNSGFTLSKMNIVDYFIDTIVDNVDGVISKYDSTVNIRKYGELPLLTEITESGAYNVFITSTDVANNSSFISSIVVIDTTKPSIVFSQTGNTFGLSISTDAFNPATGLTISDILTNTVTSSTDNMSTVIQTITTTNLSGVTFTDVNVGVTDINDIDYTHILVPGNYSLLYSVSDLSGNIVLYSKTLVVSA